MDCCTIYITILGLFVCVHLTHTFEWSNIYLNNFSTQILLVEMESGELCIYFNIIMWILCYVYMCMHHIWGPSLRGGGRERKHLQYNAGWDTVFIQIDVVFNFIQYMQSWKVKYLQWTVSIHHHHLCLFSFEAGTDWAVSLLPSPPSPLSILILISTPSLPFLLIRFQCRIICLGGNITEL